jgi:hypothetical protein
MKAKYFSPDTRQCTILTMANVGDISVADQSLCVGRTIGSSPALFYAVRLDTLLDPFNRACPSWAGWAPETWWFGRVSKSTNQPGRTL